MKAPVRVEPPRDDAARRTLAPFGRRRLEVLENRALGAYRVLVAADPEGPAPRPGQFYMLATAEEWGGGAGERPYLPRAFSVMRHRAGALEFILEDVGPGTHRLGVLSPGDGLLVSGPLGVGFAGPDEGRRPLHVGGGIGVAPLAIWQDEIGGSALLGFRSGAHAEAAGLLADVRLATDDGSAGRQGLVTDLLREELDADAGVTVYACGPPAMLEAVRALTAERGVPAQLAMESGMACGFGACFGCVVPTRSGYLRLCVEGPVVDAAELETALVPGAGH
jgi:dihydroorotate dehydrogenase electron transfer subunit